MMKMILVRAIFLKFLLGVFGLAAVGAGELDGLKLKYGVARERLTKPTQTLLEKYQARMLELQERYSKAGDLNAALVARQAAGGEPDPEQISKQPPEIAMAQNIYLKEKGLRSNATGGRLLSLDRAYHQQLLKLVTNLTRAGDVEGARDADAEAVRVLETMPILAPDDERCEVEVECDRSLSVQDLKAGVERLSGGYRPHFDSVSGLLNEMKFTRVPWGKSPKHKITAKSDGYLFVFAVSEPIEITGDVEKRRVTGLIAGAWLGKSAMYRIGLKRGESFSCTGGECTVIAKEITLRK